MTRNRQNRLTLMNVMDEIVINVGRQLHRFSDG
jgi:hypothetical protein